jgi:hypothetical protein
MKTTLSLHLQTLFVLDTSGRILSTHEPMPKPGALFHLDRLATQEPPLSDDHAAPVFARRYHSLVGGQIHSGPAFTFPQSLPQPTGVVEIDDEGLLEHHFQGWMPGEIRAGRAPMLAILEQGYPVSVCFCSRRTNLAAEAGVETALEHRGRGYGSRVTAAWALAVRGSGRIPMYSTDWSNSASLALARKLGLEVYAVDWSISD